MCVCVGGGGGGGEGDRCMSGWVGGCELTEAALYHSD